MNPIVRDLARLNYSTRDTDLDEREVRWLEDKGARWDLVDVEIFCSIVEKVREAGYLSVPATSGGLMMHREPGKDAGWSATTGGHAYMGRSPNVDPEGPMPRLEGPLP